MSLQFTSPAKDRAIIAKIAKRAVALFGSHNFTGKRAARLHHHMNLSACHASGCPLRLEDLLAADDFNFMHDIAGIDRHLSHETGELEGYFRPRFARLDIEPDLKPYFRAAPDPTGEHIDAGLLA